MSLTKNMLSAILLVALFVANCTGQATCSDCGGAPCAAGLNCCLADASSVGCFETTYGGCDATGFRDGPCAGAAGDPHMTGAHGDKWDFKGKNNVIYNALSAAYVTVNALFQHKRYMDAGPKHRVVDGSYIMEGYVVVRTALGRLLHIEYDAARAVAIKVGVDGTEALTTYKAPFSMTIDDVTVTLNGRVATIKTPQWAIGFGSKLKPGMLVGAGTTCADGKCYLETSISPRVNVTTLEVAPHGLIGQTYDSDDIGIIGKLDQYKPDKDGVITTSAMGEGAIEGVAADYEVSSKFATDFKFSRWGKAEAKPRDVSQLTGQKVKVGTKGTEATATATELEHS